MKTLNSNHSLRLTVLLTTLFASTVTLATPPSDAQSQARTLLSNRPVHAVAASIGSVSQADHLDAQAQARVALLGVQPTLVTTAAGSITAAMPAINAQTQARWVLLGTGNRAETRSRSDMDASMPELKETRVAGTAN